MATKGTKRDREKLRTRVQQALGERTQKDLEQATGLPAGTLTRAFGGRRNVDVELLDAIAGFLDTTGPVLAKGTAFAALYAEPEPEPEVASEPEPEPEVAPEPEPEVAPEPEAAPEPEPAPEPERRREERARKRDLPMKIVKFLTGLLGG